MLRRLNIILILVANLIIVNCDLPIHVTTSDVVGKWRFDYTRPLHYWIDGCGSDIPNKNTQNLQPALSDYNKWLKEKTNGEELETIKLILTDSLFSRKDFTNLSSELLPQREGWTYLAVKDADTGEIIGRWTTVYDEGFEVVTNKMTIFGFMKYNLLRNEDCDARDGDNETSKGETLCYETDSTRLQIGWYYIRGSMERGCISGTKEEPLFGETLSEIVRNRVEIPIRRSIEKSIRSLSNSLQEFANKHNSKITKNWRARNNFSVTDLAFSHHPFYMHFANPRKIHSSKLNEHSTFIELSRNNIEVSNYIADNMIEEIFACNVSRERINVELPKSYSTGDPFNDENFQDYPYNQGNCGSCYAVSAVYILAKRTEIMLNKITNGASKNEKIVLSSQSVLSCSPFNQGCEGGYPFLVGKQAEEIGISSEQCMSYLADANQECNFSPFITPELDDRLNCSQNDRMFAKEYGYVGGCYGCCDEERMKREIYEFGPIAVAIHIDTSLLVYDNGIYDSVPTDHTKYCDIPNGKLNGWEYTNHAVVITGWGEENGIPYWIVRNSWGANWGKKGYAKIRRGKNIGGIENQAVFIDPDFSRGMGLSLLNKYNGIQSVSNKQNSDLLEVVQDGYQGSEKVDVAIEEGEIK